MNDSKTKFKVIVKCPVCQHRMFDKFKGASGVIELKCPFCNKISKVDLSFRLAYNLYYMQNMGYQKEYSNNALYRATGHQ